MRRRRTQGVGRLFRRMSRHTGKPMATWWLAYYVNGREARESAHTADRQAALDKLRERLKGISDGTVVDPARDRLTVAAILDGLLAYYDRQGHRSRVSAASQTKPWRATIGSLRALAVTSQRLDRVIDDWRQAGVQAASINRRLSLLRRAYRLAKLRLDPARLDFAERFLSENSLRGRYIDRDAYEAICARLPARLQALFEFAQLCGTRKGQLALTTWAHWNSHTRELTWTKEEVKAKRDFVLPLDGRPLEIILALHAERRLHCRYMFHGLRCAPGRRPSKAYGCLGDFKKAWGTACKKAGFPVGRASGGYVFHHTRNTAVTNLVNAGVPAHEAMAVSGHRTRSVFDRYSIPLKDQTRSALRRTSDYVASLPTEPTVVPMAAAKGES